MLDRTILTVLLRWDYGRKERGESTEKRCFFDTLKGLVRRVEPFWFDDHLGDLPALQKALLEKADELEPDLVFFVPYREEFSIETLDALKERHRTYAWFGDDSWRFESFTREYAPHFTFVSTTEPIFAPRYEAIGVRPILTQWAADPRLETRADAEDGPSFDVTFIGAKNEVRGWFVRTLERRGVKVECFGRGWPNGPVPFGEMGSIFRRSRINLNLSNSVTRDIRFVLGGPRNLARALVSKKQREQVKARNFEIAMAGGFQLSQYAPALERYFHVGREIAVFSSPEDCADQAAYYLSRDQERREIARSGQARARSEHSYRHRLESILGTVFA